MIDLSTDRLTLLKERTQHCCCKYCGGALEIRRITFNDIGQSKIEIFCSQCDKIEYGVEKEIYQSARYFVEESGFDHYPQLDATEQTQKMNVAKVSEIMSWIMQHTGLLDEHGFTVPVAIEAAAVGSSLLLDDDLLRRYQEEASS